MPRNTNEKTGNLIKETLAANYPEARDFDVANLPDFDTNPALIDTVVTGELVERVAKKLSGSAGPSGVDSISMPHWLLKFGEASASLRKSITKLVEWLANGYPPWTAYRAMTWSRLVGLDKYPGVRPIGIGNILRRLVCKVLLIVVGNEATRACGTDQLCSRLEARIEGGGDSSC